MYIVLVLVAVRFASWTMMAELCVSVDDFIVLFSSNFSNWNIRIYIYVSWEPADAGYKKRAYTSLRTYVAHDTYPTLTHT